MFRDLLLWAFKENVEVRITASKRDRVVIIDLSKTVGNKRLNNRKQIDIADIKDGRGVEEFVLTEAIQQLEELEESNPM